MTQVRASRAGIAALGALALVLVIAAPAAADPPRPTNYRSTVTEIAPALPDGVEVRVVGGDSLLELSIPRGMTALVSDYPSSGDEETAPYLRFDADGTVRRNRLAIATTANERRFGDGALAPAPYADPRWETVATNGTYAWHDHRIHWMSPKAPRVVAGDGQVDLGGIDGTWSVPITVEGTPTVIVGELTLVPAPSPTGWTVLAMAIAAAVAGIGLRWGLRVASAIAVVECVAVALVTVATARAVPSGAGWSPVPLLLAALAPVTACLSLVPSARVRRVFVAATAACLLGWALARWTVLTRAVLPTTLPYGVDRAVTAAAIGVGLGLAVALVWRPSGRPASAAPAGPTGPADPSGPLTTSPTA